jgi:hypothetical protein
MKMFYLYWPKKSVPSWLEKIKFKGESNGVPKVHHDGAGFVIKKNEVYQVYPFFGNFIYIYAAGMHIEMTGGAEGVHIHL